MDTATDSQILTLAQWFSPAFPVGGFHFSHGLEQAIECGDIRDADALRGWIRDVTRHGSGWSDAVFIAVAYRADQTELASIDETARAFAASAERLYEASALGSAFARIVGSLDQKKVHPYLYPVAIGTQAAKEALPLRLTIAMFLQAFTANLATVGMRLIPIGQSDGQQIIKDAIPLCQQMAGDAANATLEHLRSGAFRADIAAMRHETQYSRIFRT